MYEKIPITGMGRGEWLALRKTGIGGSDAAAVCGLNPYSSPMKVFMEKTQEVTKGEDIEDGPSEAIRIGHDLEQYVADRFCEATGKKVRKSNYMYRSLEHPFMIADVDRMIVGEDAGLECKTASAYSADKWKDGDIPIHYVLQCLHYMAVTGRKTWYIAAIILGREFVWRRLEWDEELIRTLIAREEAFWFCHVKAGKMPNPDGSETCNEVLRRYFARSNRKSVPLVGFDEKLERRKAIEGEIEALETEKSRIEQQIKLFMAENEESYSEKFRVTWANVDTTRLDTKKLKEDAPDVYAKYAKTSSSRRFSVKAA